MMFLLATLLFIVALTLAFVATNGRPPTGGSLRAILVTSIIAGVLAQLSVMLGLN